MDARTVGKPRVENRFAFVDFAAHRLGEIVHGRTKRVLAEKQGVRLFDNALPLDVDLTVAIDHDFGDRVVVQEFADGC